MKIAKQTAKKILIILLIVFGGLILLGGGIFTIGMSVAGWDFSVMNTVNYQYTTYTETQEITNIELDFDTNDIKVFFDETATQVRVEYAEKYSNNGNQLTQTTITEENGSLKIEQERKFIPYMEFSVGESSLVNVYLPKNRVYTLNIETDTGDIGFSGNATLRNLCLETDTGCISLSGRIDCSGTIGISVDTGSILISNFITERLLLEADTGNITLDGKCEVKDYAKIVTDTGNVTTLHTLSVSSALTIKTSTGDVRLNDIFGAILTVETSTGDITSIGTSVLDFQSLILSTSTGDITIHLTGKADEYSIQAYTNTGNNNLYDFPDASKPRSLKIHSSTGNIKGIFQPNTIGK